MGYFLVIDKRFYVFKSRDKIVEWIIKLGYNKKKIMILNNDTKIVEYEGLAQVYIKYYNDIYETMRNEFYET